MKKEVKEPVVMGLCIFLGYMLADAVEYLIKLIF
jgi:hypothetical protein